MRKTTLSRSLLLTAALALGGNIQAQEQQQVLYYDEAAPVTSIDQLTNGDYVLDLYTSNVGETGVAGLVFYNNTLQSDQYRVDITSPFDGGVITDEKYIWTLTWNDDNSAFTLQNKSLPDVYFATGSKMPNGRNNMQNNGIAGEYAPIAVSDNADGRFFFKLTNPREDLTGGLLAGGASFYLFTNSGNNETRVISYFESNGTPASTSAAAQIQFLPVTSKRAITITYKYTFNGKEVGQQDFTQQIPGESLPTPTYEFPAFVTASAPEGVVNEGTTEYTINCTWEGPFAISESVQNATWYALGLHNAPYYLHDTNGAESMELGAGQQTFDASTNAAFDAQMWCFVGDPFDGFKLYNKAAGAGKILSSSTTMSGQNDGSTYPILVDEATLPKGNNTAWDVTPSTDISGVNGFYIAQHGLASNRMNLRDGRLAYWTGSADHGSTFRVLNLQALYNAELGTYVSVSQSHPGYLGVLNPEVITGNQKTIDALAEGTGTPEDYVTLYNAFNNPEHTLTLTDGGYYRLHCAPVRGNFVLSANAANMGLRGAAPSTSDASQIWKAVRTEDGKYKLITQGYAIGGENSLSLVDEAEAATFYFGKNLTRDSQGDSHIIWFFDTTNSQSSNTGNSALNVVNQDNITLLPNNYGASAWMVEEVTSLDVTMNTVGDETWATLYLPFSVTTPTGLTAYTGTQKDENTIELTAIEDDVIPAGTGVVLKGTTDSYTLTLTNNEAAPVEDNVFTGTCLPVSVTEAELENYYVLSTLGGVIGLYWPMTGTTELAANKAFIEKPEAAGAAGYRFVFGDNTTVGIDGVTLGQPDNTPYYDLSGRRIAQPAKGIYIHNGKKVFIK